MKRKDGYTLIEMVIVMAIIAGMAALALPSIDRFVKSIETYKAISQQLKAIRKHRDAAIAADGPVWYDGVWWCPFQCEGVTYDVDNRRIKVGNFYQITISVIDNNATSRYNGRRDENTGTEVEDE